jgi:hypothetical protein
MSIYDCAHVCGHDRRDIEHHVHDGVQIQKHYYLWITMYSMMAGLDNISDVPLRRGCRGIWNKEELGYLGVVVDDPALTRRGSKLTHRGTVI